jgi:hypothetical protein
VWCDMDRCPGVPLDAGGKGAGGEGNDGGRVERARDNRGELFQGAENGAGLKRAAPEVDHDDVGLLGLEGTQGAPALKHHGGECAPRLQLVDYRFDRGWVAANYDDPFSRPGGHLPILRRFSRQRRTHSSGG